MHNLVALAASTPAAATDRVLEDTATSWLAILKSMVASSMPIQAPPTMRALAAAMAEATRASPSMAVLSQPKAEAAVPASVQVKRTEERTMAKGQGNNAKKIVIK